jgi:Ni/Fe-hydrogenase 1 B-type cytochrome subunit
MQQENIRYVLVWSGWLRLSHWLIAAGILFQITSAWAIGHNTADYAFWLDWHLITGQIILMALALRAVLFFFPGSSSWRAFIPEKSQLQAMLQMIKFYLSLARFPLPNWYAHNPLWLPLYLLMFFVLAACPITGLLYDSPKIIFGFTMVKLHSALASMITIFSIAHIASVFLHDLKGKGAFISAMVNGHRYFHFTNQKNKNEHSPGEALGKMQVEKQSVYISADSIKNIQNSEKRQTI